MLQGLIGVNTIVNNHINEIIKDDEIMNEYMEL
jgi:hypothetical protein